MRPYRRERQRADALDDVLHGRPVDDEALARESAALVRAAEAVLRAEHPEPDPTFVVALRERVLAEAPAGSATHTRTVVTVRDPRHRAGRRRAAVLVASLAVTAGSVGLVSASASALPGQELYPVKQAVERVELGLQRGPTGTGRKQLALAEERLTEVQTLASDGIGADERAPVADALDEFARRAQLGTADLLRAYAERGTTGTIREVDAFVGASDLRLQRLRGVLPTVATSALARADDTVRGIGAATSRACDGCAAAENAGRVGGVVPAPGPGTDGSTGAGSVAPRPEATSRPSAAPRPGGSGRPAPSPAPSAAPSVQVPPSAVPSEVAPSEVPTLVPDPLRSITDPLLGGLLGGADPAVPSATPTDPAATTPPGLLDGLLAPQQQQEQQPQQQPPPQE